MEVPNMKGGFFWKNLYLKKKGVIRKIQPEIATRAMHELQYVEIDMSLQIILNWTIICDQFQS